MLSSATRNTWINTYYPHVNLGLNYYYCFYHLYDIPLLAPLVDSPFSSLVEEDLAGLVSPLAEGSPSAEGSVAFPALDAASALAPASCEMRVCVEQRR